MNKSSKQKGFTLIELLVVIAIIGILASVVLASLNTARAKGADANIKANLANARAQAQIYYDIGNTYYVDSNNNVCTIQGIFNLVEAARVTAGGTATQINGAQIATVPTSANCNVTTDAWLAQVQLKQPNVVTATSGTDYYCVDSTGASRVEDAPLVTFAAGTPTSCI